MERICTKCHKLKSFSEFGKQKGGKFGLKSKCKKCTLDYVNGRYRDEPLYRAKIKEKRKRYQEKFPEKIKSRSKRYNVKARRRIKSYILKHNYGLSPETYLELCERQDDLCAICFKTSRKPLYVDHCHTTGIVRGLLCLKCNMALGLFNESEQALNSAIDYLINSKTKLSRLLDASIILGQIDPQN